MSEANPPQIEDLRRRARRRLVGAIVLALAAAVLVPILLESDPKPLGEDVSVKIPPIDDGKFVNKVGEKARTADAPAKPAAKPPVSVLSKEPPKDPSPVPQATAPSKPAAEPVPKPQPAEASPTPAMPKPAAAEPPKSAAAEPPKPAPASASGTFNVQLGAYSDDKGANALANKLKSAGHTAYVEPYKSSRGTLWRVRVGPFSTMAAAQAEQTKLKAAGHDGIIPPAN